METFKLKVSLGDAQIELEGNENMVQTIFQELRDQGLGALQPVIKMDKPASSNNNPAASNIPSRATPAPDDANSPPAVELPTLENVVLKGGPKTEVEWLLIYALYCSNQGSSFFTRDDLRAKYDETNRFTDARGKNFASNIKSVVSNGYISAVNANDFRIESTGILKAKSILQGTTTGKGDKPKGKTTSSKKAPASYKLLELGLTESERQSFKNFWNSHNHTSHIDKAIIAAHWLKKEKNVNDFSADLLFTMLRIAEEKVSFDLLSAIKNAKNQKSCFITGTESNTYAINHIGEDRVKSLEQKGE